MTNKQRTSSWIVLSFVLSILLAACGGAAATPGTEGGGTDAAPTVGDVAGADVTATAPVAGEAGETATAPIAGETAPAGETAGATVVAGETVAVPATAGGEVGATATTGGEAGAGQVVAPANAAALGRLSGNIVSDGSSTVQPVTQAAAEEFRKYAKNVRVSVGTSGTGGGFEKFCAGETDISNASRAIEPDEVAACAENNIEFIEVPVAVDGLTVVVNPENDWATCLTVQELRKIWQKGSELNNWNQVRPAFPDEELGLFGPGTDSGTFDYFTEAINGEEGNSRTDYEASEDDNQLVQGVVGSGAGATGYFGYAYFQANQEELKAVEVDNGDGCVAPSFETIRNNTYAPLSRPLFLYVKAESAKRPEVQQFIRFVLSNSFTPLIQTGEVGYVSLTPQQYQGIASRFRKGTTGTLVREGQRFDINRYK